jgi:Fe-S cluster assembly iron-binding protein IscA
MITITKRAAEEIGLSTQNPDTQGLLMRFAVDKTDQGFHYLMGFDERSDADIHLESNGIEYLLTYAQKELLEVMVVVNHLRYQSHQNQLPYVLTVLFVHK